MKAHAALFAVLASAALTGCSPSMFNDASSGYDSQGCVEDALRRSADPGITRRAAARFEFACNEGDAAACSALGVVVELASERGPGLRRAEALYRQACQAGNERGCVNLAAFLEAGATAEPQPLLALAYYRHACSAGDQAGCAKLGGMIARGHGGPGDQEQTTKLLQGACDEGNAQACFDLAQRDERDSSSRAPSRQEEVLTNYVRACVGGHRLACQKMDAGRPAVAQRQSGPTS